MLAAGLIAPFYSSAGATAAPQAREPDVDRIFEPWAGGHSPGCAVSVMRDGEIVLSRGYGRAHLEYDIPITPSSVFHVASVAKQFTALAVQLLVNENRVSWDDDIREHVPEVAGLDRPITLSQLAHHTSGIRDQWSLLRMAGWRPEAELVTSQDVLELLSRQEQLNFDPGSDYLYSNSGYTLLALVVERETGQSLRAFTAERIFEPLGMTTTHFHDDHQMVVPNRAYAYALDRAGGFRSSIPDFDIVGATSLFTTVEDLALWERNFYTFEVGGESGVSQLHERGKLTDGRSTTYARGLAHGSYRGLATVGHGGTDAGYRSEFVRFPDQRLAVAVLCNLRSTNPSELARRVADVYLSGPDRGAPRPTAVGTGTSRVGGAPRPSDRGTEPDPNLSRFGGYYRRHSSDVPLHIVERQGVLVTIGTGPDLRFLPVDDTRFRVTGDMSTSAQFDGGDGKGTPTTMRLGDAEPDVYERLEPWRPTDLADFEGVYESRELDIDYAFSVRDRRLVLSNRKLGAITLVPTYPDGFYGEGFYLAFGRNRSGAVEGFTVSTTRAWKVRFRKTDKGH